MAKTTYTDYGCTATISDQRDGTARLVIKAHSGKKVHDKIHSSHKAAYAAWRRFCN